MRRPLTVDVARTLPAKPSLADPAPECAGTDHNALCAQMCGQQWHGPGIGVMAELAWVAREELAELLICGVGGASYLSGPTPCADDQIVFHQQALTALVRPDSVRSSDRRCCVQHARVWQPRPGSPAAISATA